MVFFLFLMRDILKELIGETQIIRVNELSYVEAFNQVSSLLNRLGLVFFESAMRLKDEEPSQQDVLAIEYALLGSGIALAIVTGVTTVGNSLSTTFANIANAFP